MPKELHEATRDCTIHLSKRYQKKKGKHLAPRSIREIRKFVEREMLTKVIFISLLYYLSKCICLVFHLILYKIMRFS